MGGPWTEGCWLPEPLKETIQLLPPERILPSFCLSENTEDRAASNAQVSPKTESQLIEESTSDNHICNSSSDNNLFSGQPNDFNEETVNNDDVKKMKERHISVDSAKDSGIGEGSNLTDGYSLGKNEHMGNLWEPKIKHSLASRLPKNMYYLVRPSRYIFPGAEVFYDPDEKYGFSDDDDDDSSESDISESDSESENDNRDNKFDTTEFEKLNNFISANKTE